MTVVSIKVDNFTTHLGNRQAELCVGLSAPTNSVQIEHIVLFISL